MTKSTITDDLYRRTEGALFRYARNKMLIGRIESEIEELDRQIIALNTELRHITVPSVGVANYSGMPAGGSGDSTSVERAAIYSEERYNHLNELLNAKLDAKVDKLERLYALREATSPVEYAYQQLEQIDQHIFTQRYFFARSNSAIALQLHYDEATVRRHKNAMLKKIADVLELQTPSLRRIV